MPKACIVDAVRTPIGRAFKGSLAQLRPDDTTAHVIDSCSSATRRLDPALVEDLLCGVGLPQGMQAFNMGRIVVPADAEAAPDDHRRDDLPLLRLVARGHQLGRQRVEAGRGDVYIAAGVEFVSRYNERQEAAGEDDKHPDLQGGNGHPDAYIAMGHTAENVADALQRLARGHGQVRPALPGARGGRPAGRLLRQGDRPGHAARRRPR